MPYGCLDADIKTYFRTVDVQIHDWQENREDDVGEAGDTNPDDLLQTGLKKKVYFNCCSG